LKEEQRKKKAIEDYETFLKTFYKSKPIKKRALIEPILEKRPTLQIEKTSNDASVVKVPKARAVDAGEVEKQEEIEEEESDTEYLFKMHQGLVKIQALIRGFLERLRFKKMQAKKILKQNIGKKGNKLPR